MINQEIKNRIKVSVAAWAYENADDNITHIMSDAEFDALSLQIHPEVETGHAVLDKFFREEFDPDTGSWVGDHPEQDKLEKLYFKVWHDKRSD